MYFTFPACYVITNSKLDKAGIGVKKAFIILILLCPYIGSLEPGLKPPTVISKAKEEVILASLQGLPSEVQLSIVLQLGNAFEEAITKLKNLRFTSTYWDNFLNTYIKDIVKTLTKRFNKNPMYVASQLGIGTQRKIRIEPHGIEVPFSQILQNWNSAGKKLIEAVLSGKSGQVKKTLQEGADINYQNKKGGTALTNAAYNGKLEMAKLLLANKAKINLQDKYGWTALMLAADKGKLEVVKLLLENKARYRLAK